MSFRILETFLCEYVLKCQASYMPKLSIQMSMRLYNQRTLSLGGGQLRGVRNRRMCRTGLMDCVSETNIKNIRQFVKRGLHTSPCKLMCGKEHEYGVWSYAVTPTSIMVSKIIISQCLYCYDQSQIR